MKPVVWLGNSHAELLSSPAEARREVGYQLWRVQTGLAPSDWKPMPSVGLGVNEIRIHTGGEYRVLYVAKFAEAVYVLHAFGKKSQKTPKADIEAGKARFQQLVKDRK